MSQKKTQSKLSSFLKIVDVFSYVPVPQAYPVSSSKSKIGSFIFIAILLGFLIFDFYQFMTNNIPTINVLQADNINTGNTTVPQIAFGIQFTNASDDYQTRIFDDDSYFNFVFQSQYIRTENNKSTFRYAQVPLKPCGGSSWSGRLYEGLTCLDLSPEAIRSMGINYPIINQNGNLIMSQTKNQTTGFREDYYFMLTLNYCQNKPNCVPRSEINDIISNSQLIFLSQQNVGYNFQKGVQISPDEIKPYSYSINPQKTSLIQLFVTSTIFVKFPNYFTGFTTSETKYSKFTKQTSQNLTYQMQYGVRMMIFPDWVISEVQIHPITFLITLSKWSAFASFIFMVSAAFFLGYNRRKFRKKNPDWQQFDEVLKTKEIQLQPLSTNNEQKDQQRPDSPMNRQKQQNNEISIRLKLLTSGQHEPASQKQEEYERSEKMSSMRSANGRRQRPKKRAPIDDSHIIGGQDAI